MSATTSNRWIFWKHFKWKTSNIRSMQVKRTLNTQKKANYSIFIHQARHRIYLAACVVSLSSSSSFLLSIALYIHLICYFLIFLIVGFVCLLLLKNVLMDWTKRASDCQRNVAWCRKSARINEKLSATAAPAPATTTNDR